MDRQELYIDNQLVELTQDVAVALNFAISDIAEPEKVKADYSKTIKLPGSETINKIFSHIYNVNIDLEHSSATFNPNIRVEARYSINSVELIDELTTNTCVSEFDILLSSFGICLKFNS